MFRGGDDFGHTEESERGRGIEHLLDLEPDTGERFGDLLDARLRVEMLLQPCIREFHGRPLLLE